MIKDKSEKWMLEKNGIKHEVTSHKCSLYYVNTNYQ